MWLSGLYGKLARPLEATSCGLCGCVANGRLEGLSEAECCGLWKLLRGALLFWSLANGGLKRLEKQLSNPPAAFALVTEGLQQPPAAIIQPPAATIHHQGRCLEKLANLLANRQSWAAYAQAKQIIAAHAVTVSRSRMDASLPKRMLTCVLRAKGMWWVRLRQCKWSIETSVETNSVWRTALSQKKIDYECPFCKKHMRSNIGTGQINHESVWRQGWWSQQADATWCAPVPCMCNCDLVIAVMWPHYNDVTRNSGMFEESTHMRAQRTAHIWENIYESTKG